MMSNRSGIPDRRCRAIARQPGKDLRGLGSQGGIRIRIGRAGKSSWGTCDQCIQKFTVGKVMKGEIEICSVLKCECM